MFGVLDYIKNYILALSESYRVLKDGGILYFTVGNPRAIVKFLKFSKEVIPIKTKLSLQTWKKILKKIGFHIEEAYITGIFGIKFGIKIPYIGDRIEVIARK